MQEKKPVQDSELKPYQPLGIPLMTLLFGMTILTLAAVALYEFFF